MANQAEKKLREQNRKTLASHRQLIAAVNVFYLVLRLGYFFDSWSSWHTAGLVLTSIVYYVCWNGICSQGEEQVDEDGEVIVGGSLSGGLVEYFFDCIYLCVFVQVTSLYSENVWYILLVVPAFALWKGWDLVLKPWIFSGSDDGPLDPRAAKKQAKLERKEARAATGKTKVVRR